MDKLRNVYAAPSNKMVSKMPQNTRPYPVAKVVSTFAAAPAIAGMLVLLLIAFGSMQLGIMILSPFVIFFAEVLFIIPAVIAGTIISAFRWQKDALDLFKAAAVGGLCALLPTLVFSPISALFMGAVAFVVSLLLAYLVLPNAEYLDFPIYQHPEPDYWAVEIPTLEDKPKPTHTQTGFYYLKDLPQNKH